MNIRIVLPRLLVFSLIALLGPVSPGNSAFDRRQVSTGVIYAQPVSGIQTTVSLGTGTFTTLDASANETPQANADTGMTLQGSPVIIDVLANDSGLGNKPLKVTVAQNPAHGSAQVLSNKRIAYSPNSGFYGTDLYRYQVCDKQNECSSAGVTVSVSKPNSSPIANDDLYSTDQGVTILVPPSTGVLSNDSDPEGSSLSTQLRSSPSNGALQLLPDGSFTYTPQPAFTGTDTFIYRASDGLLSSNNATAAILVIDKQIPTVVWLAPVADGQVSYVKDETVILRVDATDNQGIASVRFVRWDANLLQFVDIGVTTTAPYEVALDTTTLNLDWNQIFAIAYDIQGNASQRQFIWIFRLGGSAPLIFLPSINH